MCAYAYTYMTKIISLSDEAYSKLKAMKGKRSFSKTVVSLMEPRRDIMEFAGIFKDRADEWGEIEKDIYNERKKFKMKEVVF